MKVYNTDPLCHIFNLSACESLWKIARKKVNNLSTKKEDYQFHVACVSYFKIKLKKAFKEQVDKCLSSKFDYKTSQQMRETLKETILVSLLLSCSTRTGSRQFSRCWLLLFIAS